MCLPKVLWKYSLVLRLQKNNVSHTFRPQGPKITGETKCGSCKNYSSGNSKEWWKM